MLVEFYDPHPGKMGASISLPKILLDAANEINGKKLDLDETLDMLQLKADTLLEEEFSKADICPDCGTRAGDDHFVLLYLDEKDGGMKHSFRVISFRVVESA